MIVENIISLDRKELHPYRTLRRPWEHFQHGYFVAEGEKVVRRLLGSGLDVLSILCSKEWFEKLLPEIRDRNLTAYVTEKTVVETIVGYNLHQGIMGIGKVPTAPPLEEFISLKDSLLLVALDGLVNAENVGVLVRNCAAFGVDGIIVGETSSSPYLRRAVRNSMGTVFKIPIFHIEDLATILSVELRKACVHTIAAHPHESKPLDSIRAGKKVCVVFGNEGDGISEKILRACDEYVGIPMANGTDSLNVANASAVFLYEIYRQKGIR